MSRLLSRRRLGALAAAVLVVSGAMLWWPSEPTTDALQRAAAVLDDGDRYRTAIAAGDALAEISGLLLDEARRCEPSRDAPRRCEAAAQAAAFAQALAVRVLDCTAPGRFEVRRVLGDHLTAIDLMEPLGPVPSLPSVPAC